MWGGEKGTSICSDYCRRKNQIIENSEYNSPIVAKFPEEVSISSDNMCNVKCRFCRDDFSKKTYNIESIEQEIENIWLPILKDAKNVRFGCTGEPFASQKELMLIKRVAQKYPDIKFHIHTNGILTSKEKLEELNIYNRIETITVSIHAATEQTYNKVVIGGDFFKVVKNLKLYSQMKKEHILKQFRMIFVVYSDNYREMVQFAQFALELGANAEFWTFRKSETQLGKEYNKYSVITNNEYKKELSNILKNPIFDNSNVILYPELKKIKEEL